MAVLLGFSAGLLYVVRVQLLRQIDSDLIKQTHNLALDPQGPGRPPPPGFPPDRSDRPPEPGRPNLYAQAQRAADVRRPRFFDPNGQPSGAGGDQSLDPSALSLANPGAPIVRTVATDEGPIRIATASSDHGIVQVGHELDEFDLLNQVQLASLLFMIPIGAIAAGLTGLLVTRLVLRPVSVVSREAASISAEHLDRRLPVIGDDEFASLSKTFNSMLEGLQQAFEQQRRFTADASHELRTPLTRLRLALDRGITASEPGEIRSALDAASRSSSEMAVVLDQLMVLARLEAGQLPPRSDLLDLRILAAEVIDAFDEPARIHTSFLDAPVTVSADGEQIKRAISNVIENALRHTPDSTPVEVSLTMEGELISLVVQDHGPGIEASHLPKLFDRFYRIDDGRSRDRGGTGLGLAIARDLVRNHGGDIQISSEADQGTRVVIQLPARI